MSLIKKIFKVMFSKFTLAIILLIIQIIILLLAFLLFEKYIIYFLGGSTILTIIIILYIINSKKNPSYKIAWILPVLILPVVGSAFFLFYQLKIKQKYIIKSLNREKEKSKKILIQDSNILNKLDKQTYNLSKYMYNTVNFPIYSCEKVKYFENGQLKFNDMLSELKKANKFIFLEYFILEEGLLWGKILEILEEKIKQGVEVRVMYDGTCSFALLPYNYPEILKKKGIKCKAFFPIKLELSFYQNNRDHRKICVIDGKVAYTGGINIGDEYINKKEKYGYWKDTAIKITGKSVNSFSAMFLEMWNINCVNNEIYEKYINNDDCNDSKNNGYIIPYGDNPLDDYETGKKVYMDMLNTATDYVDIITPYLILDDELLSSIIYASNRGVKVRIIMPHIPDKKLVYYLGRSFYKDLITNGVEVYEFEKGFTHAKMFISDNCKAVVGTINLDYRSLYLHFECACYIYKNEVISDIQKDYNNTINESIKITKKDIENYNIFKRIIGRILRILAPLM